MAARREVHSLNAAHLGLGTLADVRRINLYDHLNSADPRASEREQNVQGCQQLQILLGEEWIIRLFAEDGH